MQRPASNSPIVFVTGPALGHIGRLYVIARSLRALTDRAIIFATPAHARYADAVLAEEFDLIRIPVPDEDQKRPAEAFADGLEAALSALEPRAVVTDMCPLRWLSAMRFPDCQRILVSNFFLTGLLRANTVQNQWFRREAAEFAALRNRRGLPALEDIYDLYKANRVLLADPSPLLEDIGPLPDNHIVTGPCSWAPGGSLPDSLRSLSGLLLLSMGSTGPTSFKQSVSELIVKWAGTAATVYVGSKHESIRDTGVADYCYDWLPLEATLAKTRAAVTHGGTGSSYLALAQGVPIVVIPTHQNHRLLGECIEKAGLGLCINGPDDLRKFETVDFGATLENVRRFSHRMVGVDGAAECARQIKEFA